MDWWRVSDYVGCVLGISFELSKCIGRVSRNSLVACSDLSFELSDRNALVACLDFFEVSEWIGRVFWNVLVACSKLFVHCRNVLVACFGMYWLRAWNSPLNC